MCQLKTDCEKFSEAQKSGCVHLQSMYWYALLLSHWHQSLLLLRIINGCARVQRTHALCRSSLQMLFATLPVFLVPKKEIIFDAHNIFLLCSVTSHPCRILPVVLLSRRYETYRLMSWVGVRFETIHESRFPYGMNYQLEELSSEAEHCFSYFFPCSNQLRKRERECSYKF